jgi:hypothetical protein
MSYRPAESFPSRGRSTCKRHTVGGKTSKKDPEQGVATGSGASETLALLTLACGEYAIQKSSVFEWQRRFQDGREDVQDDPSSGHSKTQSTDANVRRGALRRKLSCETESRGTEYGDLSGGGDPNSGQTTSPRMKRYDTLAKWAIHPIRPT